MWTAMNVTDVPDVIGSFSFSYREVTAIQDKLSHPEAKRTMEKCVYADAHAWKTNTQTSATSMWNLMYTCRKCEFSYAKKRGVEPWFKITVQSSVLTGICE